MVPLCKYTIAIRNYRLNIKWSIPCYGVFNAQINNRSTSGTSRAISVCGLLPEHPTNVWAWSGMIDHLYRSQVCTSLIKMPWRVGIGPEQGPCLSQRASSGTIPTHYDILISGCRSFRARKCQMWGWFTQGWCLLIFGSRVQTHMAKTQLLAFLVKRELKLLTFYDKISKNKISNVVQRKLHCRASSSGTKSNIASTLSLSQRERHTHACC